MDVVLEGDLGMKRVWKFYEAQPILMELVV
jgi:hypothetical protein